MRKTSLSRARWTSQVLLRIIKVKWTAGKRNKELLLLPWVAGLLQVTQCVDNTAEAAEAFQDPDKRLFSHVYSFIFPEQQTESKFQDTLKCHLYV